MKFYQKSFYIQFILVINMILFCTTAKEIPVPLKGSLENPVYISRKEKVLECFKKLENQNQLKIKYIDTISGMDFHFVDIFSFPYKKWYKKMNKENQIFEIPDEYYFYIDSYHNIDECKEKNLEELLEFP